MIADLFDKPKSGKDKLWQWINQRRYVKTSEILRWGIENYSNRADRNARLLAQENKIRRMPREKKIMYFGPIKEDVWEVVNFHN